jgi:uncharacterized Zn finger protein (UPF0148 family)
MIERNLDIPEYRQCKICDTYLVKDFLGEYYCPECEKEVVDNVKCPIADHAPDCPILHHQKRKEGK